MLIDTTLREGAQLYGAYFNAKIRTAILDGLLAVGVDEIELGWIGMEGLEETAVMAHSMVAAMAVQTTVSVWSPCRVQAVEKAANLGFTRANIGVPVSQKHMSKRLGMDRKELLERVHEVVTKARALGLEVAVGLEDISRADRNFSLQVALIAEKAGAFRVRLPDTVGVLNPLEMQAFVQFFKNNVTMKLAVHCHNDFGMATANAVTALSSGADYTDVSVLGIGERAGIAALEEVAAYLSIKGSKSVHQTMPNKYNLQKLGPLCELVAQAANVSISRTKAIVGANIFACESGLHVHGLARDTSLFEPFAPELIGAERLIGYGEKCGQGALKYAFRENEKPASQEAMQALLQTIRHVASELGRPLAQEEVCALAEKNMLN